MEPAVSVAFESSLPVRVAAPAAGSSGPREALLLVALLLLAGHAWLFGDWLIDDAGISFSYARSLAAGDGLVSQAGAEPVEGFSNPLWTLLLSPFFAAGAFLVPWTPKILAVGLLAGAFVLVVREARGRGGAAWLAAAPVVLLAVNTSFVVWGVSGLENPLLALLAALSATLALRAAEGERGRLDIVAGIVAGLLALTRPDAVLYAVAYPLVLWLARGADGFRARLGRLTAYGLGFVAVFGPWLAFRRLYFGDWVPNTFHAKVRPWMLSLDATRLVELLESAAGRMAPLVLLLLSGSALLLARRGRLERRHLVLFVYLGLAGAAYLLLPPDWMGEYRFATAFFLFSAWLLGAILASLWSALLDTGSPMRWLAPAAALLLLAETTSAHAVRSADFARNPVVPFARISEFGVAYDRLALALGPGDHSLLAPDLGGTLFRSRLRVYDLAGLCDRTVARTLMGDRPAFHDYVFETARPTFIHVHSSWANWAALHSDPRFARDYATLHETWERPRGAEPGEGEPWSGDYVRLDALRSQERLGHLRRDFRRLGLDEPMP